VENTIIEKKPGFLKKILNRIILLIQLILVLIFIVFEEIIWEGLAKPIYIFIYDLHILQTLQKKLTTVNRYTILSIFMILLISVEGAGIIAGIMAVKGMVVTAMLLYILKIPIAAFTFWLFRATESKLLSFGWFKYSYEKLINTFSWIKEREIYKKTLKTSKELKKSIKQTILFIKKNYITGDNSLSKRFKKLYTTIKNFIKRELKS